MAVARICVTAAVTSAARTLLSRGLRFCEQPQRGLGVTDGGGRGEPEYEGQVEGVGAGGEGFGEDTVDADVFEPDALPQEVLLEVGGADGAGAAALRVRRSRNAVRAPTWRHVGIPAHIAPARSLAANRVVSCQAIC